jgi:ectoine hydroxylase-related dioxygenase (phytanoyl-CoA dioxygenase family)
MRVSRKEVKAGQLTPRTLKQALRELGDAGFVVLEQVVDPVLIAEVRTAFEPSFEKHTQQPDLQARIDSGAKYIGMHVPFAQPFTNPAICANPLAVQIMKAAIGEIVCTFYHSNTTLPGETADQPIHIDMPSLLFPGLPVALPPWLVVVNFPLIDFTPENGGTEIWPGTHLNTDERDLAERCGVIPSIRATVRVGDLVIRDLRTWHRGVPNRTNVIRTMLAIVYNRPWFQMPPSVIQISRREWEALPEYAQQIFKRNTIVD